MGPRLFSTCDSYLAPTHQRGYHRHDSILQARGVSEQEPIGSGTDSEGSEPISIFLVSVIAGGDLSIATDT
jgi:hypothetical protein